MAERASGGVQSVGRVLDLLEIVGDAGGEIGLSELAARSGLPLPSIHRLVRTLVSAATCVSWRIAATHWAPRLVPLGQSPARCSAPGRSRCSPVSSRPWANRRTSPSSTTTPVMYIGSALPAHDADVHRARPPGARALHGRGQGAAVAALGRRGARVARPHGHACRDPEHDHHPDAMLVELAKIRREGHALDEGEQEVGVRCVAVPVHGALGTLGISVSGPTPRMTPELVERAIPLLARRRRAVVVGDRRPLRLRRQDRRERRRKA